jgi:hypothetical protein
MQVALDWYQRLVELMATLRLVAPKEHPRITSSVAARPDATGIWIGGK